MAYLHCRIRTRIQNRIRTPNPMHYAKVFTLHGSQIQIPILTANNKNGIGIGIWVRTQARLRQCEWAITTTCTWFGRQIFWFLSYGWFIWYHRFTWRLFFCWLWFHLQKFFKIVFNAVNNKIKRWNKVLIIWYISPIRWIFQHLSARPWWLDFAVWQIYFQITCPNGQAEILKKYHYLFSITSWFSLGKVKYGATRPNGQVGVNS